MKLSRRAVIKGGTALAVSSFYRTTSNAQSAEFSYRFGNSWPATHSANVCIAEAAERVKRESNGRMEILLFPNSQLGGDPDLISQVRSGALEFTLITNVILGTLVPVASLPNMGFAFPDLATAWQTLDGELGKYIRAAIEKVNLFPFEKFWDNGYRQITTRDRPIKSLSDLHGLKIRVPPSPVLMSMFKALGASPGNLSFNEVYSALQTGIFDAQENPLAVVDSAKLYEVQKHCSLTSHMWDGGITLSNARAWKRLPQELQDITTRAFSEAVLKQRERNRALNENLQKELSEHGMVFSTVDTKAFRERLKEAGFYQEWSRKFGEEAWSKLESVTGKLL